MEVFRVRVVREDTGFSAAHFITFGDGECERLHGHNYKVGVELRGSMAPGGMVYDFSAIGRLLAVVVRKLDHRMLLPSRNPRIRVEEHGARVRAVSGDREWVFPRGDCVILPVENATAEEIAAWISLELRGEMERSGLGLPEAIETEVEESPGHAAVHEWTRAG
jgi:6-pyruvoyltetrahydropterin/6-carboxytetrahydropterin synthase